MTDRHVGSRVDSSLFEALDEAAHQARTSKSELIRLAIREFILSGGDSSEVEFDLPDHLEKQIRRERLKSQNKLRHQRIHFPSNVQDRFTRAFKQGDLDPEINPGAIDELKEIWIEDAQLLFDDPDRQQRAVGLVETLADKAREAEDATAFSAVDPDHVFERFGGVREGKQREEVSQQLGDLADDALELITDELGGTTIDSERVEPEEAEEILSNRTGVPESVAKEAVDRAVSQLPETSRGGSVAVSDGGSGPVSN